MKDPFEDCVSMQTIIELSVKYDQPNFTMQYVCLYKSHDEKSLCVSKNGKEYTIPFSEIASIKKL